MSDNATPEQPLEGDLTRRELLARAGAIGAGAVVAGSLGAKTAKAAVDRTAQRPPRGGTLNWALEQDPAHIAPFGGILTSNHWGKELMYDSLLEWDPKLNLRSALASEWDVVDSRTIVFTLKRGIRFHNGKELTAADCKYSFDLQANPPPPGSTAVLGQFPAIERTEVLGKYRLRMRLRTPDARVFGYLAWGRYSPIVPEGMYQQVNPGREGIGTGPFRLVTYVPNDRLEFVRNPRFWRQPQPFLNAVNFKVLTDEQARIAALRAGAIDGATLSADSARQFRNNNNFRVLSNFTAAFRELQMTWKPGARKPWHDVRVRQAVNHALNRQEIINRVYSGNGEYSGHVPPGYGPWPLPVSQLRNRYLKFDLARARTLMRQAGFANGFEVTMTTFSTPLDFQQVAAVMRQQLDRIGIELRIEAQEPGTFAANNGRGNFDWDLTARGMRGDVDGYLAEFNPSASIYNVWYPQYRNVRVWRLVGNGRITLNQARRIPMYKEAQRLLLNDLVQVPLFTVRKFQVVRRRVNNMYVAFSDFNTGIRYVFIR
ncbi:MAG TPA: ABC transporter substrate-binding protein [Gaiellaceae bacterium]|nr:ABC transporter substrate-binding protein [Gaiellaceae bacterium]